MLQNPTTGEYLTVGIDLPTGLDVPKGQCKEHHLTEDNPRIDVDIMPDCNALRNNRHETKVIVITFQGGGEFWMARSTLRTVWVRICLH